MRLLTSLLILTSSFCFAEEINNSYSTGIKFFQESNFELAKQNFEAALSEQPQNPFINYNLALTEWKLGHVGRALGLLRKAQYFDPTLGEAKDAEKVIKEGLKVKDLPHQISIWEGFRREILTPLSLNSTLAVLALLLVAVGFIVPQFIRKHRRFKESEDVSPPNPTASLVTLFLVLGMLMIFGAKIYDLTIPRATVVTDKIGAKSGPEPDSPSLFDLFEGLEVIVRRSFLDSNQKRWLQVTYPGGMTGWVPEDAVLTYSD